MLNGKQIVFWQPPKKKVNKMGYARIKIIMATSADSGKEQEKVYTKVI
jgi:hypothetical protein